ncbi:MAG: DUF2852 domain-containing protein [Lautropia sp.]
MPAPRSDALERIPRGAVAAALRPTLHGVGYPLALRVDLLYDWLVRRGMGRGMMLNPKMGAQQMTGNHGTFDSGSTGLPAAAGNDTALLSSGWYIAAIVVAFILFWPLGVAMLAWALWHRQIRASSLWQKLSGVRAPRAADFDSFVRRRPSNEALAEYLAREQQRLREEQQKLDELVQAFEAFKAAERKASDQRDFENFLRQREAGGRAEPDAGR